MHSKMAPGGELFLDHVPAQKIHKVKGLKTPWGRVMWTRDRGESRLLAEHYLMTNLRMIHRDGDGRLIDVYDTGSGLVTNVGVNLMSYDWNWVTTYTTSTLAVMNFHALGTGATAAAATDAWLQTAQGTTNLSGTTNGYMTGTQTSIANATAGAKSPVYQTTATFTATGAVAATEWIIAASNAANINNLANSVTASSLTDSTHTPFGASNAQKFWTVEGNFAGAQTIPINTPTTTPTLQVFSNSTTVLTAVNNTWSTGVKTWLDLTNTAATTPSSLNYIVFPTAWDHKVFSVVNLASADTLQTTYQLSVNSGG